MNEPVDVVIVNYHCADEIAACLVTLGTWHMGRIWLVDNNGDESEHDVLTDLAARWPEVTLLSPGENLGFGRGCNLAWSRSKAPWVLLLNPDARMERSDVATLRAALVDHPNWGAVSPVTFWNADRTFVLPCPSAQSPMAHGSLIAASWWPSFTRLLAQQMVKKNRRVMSLSAGVRRVAYLAGAALLLRRAAVEAAGGLFDPQFFMFFEDTDLSVRLARAGYELALVPRAQAVHTYRHKSFKAALMAEGQRAFFKKNHPIYWQWSRGLVLPQLFEKPMSTAQWFEELGELDCASAFTKATHGAGVVAFSPSVRMFPAIVRPEDVMPRPWSNSEWALLEPGAYVALVNDAGAEHWVHFVRTDS